MQLSLVDMDDRIEAIRLARERCRSTVRRRFDERFLLGWIYHELSVEGVVLSEHDLKRALSGRSGTDYCDKQLLETIRRYRRAIERLQQAVEEREPVSLRLLLHYLEILGSPVKTRIFRTDDGASGNYKHDVVPPEEVEAAFEEFIDETRTRMLLGHPVRHAMEAHYRFVKIWPFPEHSALLARLVANHVLLAGGYPPALVHANDRRRYYHSLHYDVSRLVDFLTESIEDQIQLRERTFGVASSHRERTAA